MESKFRSGFKMVLAGLIGVSAYSLQAADSLRTEKKAGRWVVIHEVEKGETLFSLSRRYQSEIDEIVEENHIQDHQLSLGQLLSIPVDIKEEEVVVSPGRPTHTVKKGETLFSLSRQYQVSVDDLKRWNHLPGNQIALEQELLVGPGPVASAETQAGPAVTSFTPVATSPDHEQVTHIVKTGETLFSISRQYNTSVGQLKQWNGLTGNAISIGQELTIGVAEDARPVAAAEESRERNEELKREEEVKREEKELPEGFKIHRVQTGETMEELAIKFQAPVDSIMRWNNLTSYRLEIGQEIMVRALPDPVRLAILTETAPGNARKWKTIDPSGFAKIFEEGVAMKIGDVVDTRKYLALHRTLPVGTLIEVRNLMNNQKVFVRVVGKLPDTGLNENVMIRLTSVAFNRLGILDPRARVEISYYQE